jgi:cell division septation protein DedD
MADKSGPSWIATLLGGLLLIVAGFAVGLVAGAAYEEPSLVVGHLAGETSEVPLPESAAPPVREEVQGASEAQPEPAPRARRAPPAELPPVSAPPPAGGFAVQVGAFATPSAADGLAAELRKLGHASYVADEGGSGARYKVRVGPIAERADADALAARLKREQRLPTWVLARESH